MEDDRSALEGLNLPKGIDAAAVLEAVKASGYPLQTVVARTLAASFTVSEEWGYVDRRSSEHRSLDLFAFRPLGVGSSRLEIGLATLVECKRSELPYVFFAAAIPQVPVAFPTIVGLPRGKFELYQRTGPGTARVRSLSLAEALGCPEMSFVKDPDVAVTFSKVERKGKDFCLSGSVPYNNVVLPLASALEHYRESWSGVRVDQPRYFPNLTVCICCLDAPLILATGTPESPKMTSTSWVRLIHEEAVRDGVGSRRKHYFVDVVSRSFLDEYLNGHLLPFGEAVGQRMTEREGLLIAGGGDVDDLAEWSWDGIRPSKK